MIGEIMTANSFAEVMFLVAFILFALEVIAIVAVSRGTTWAYGGLLMAAGFACMALGWLALTTGE